MCIHTCRPTYFTSVSTGLLFFFSGVSQAEEKYDDSPYTMWVPGRGCPVRKCGARGINVLADMKRHWREKHEEIVPKFHCTACSYVSKRKSNLGLHFRKRHGPIDRSNIDCVDKVEYQINLEYIDPSPLTLEIVLGKIPTSNRYPIDKA